MLNKKIILGVTGSISAYKAAELIRLLKKRGADVQVVMTKSAKEFISPTHFTSFIRQACIRKYVGTYRRKRYGAY